MVMTRGVRLSILWDQVGTEDYSGATSSTPNGRMYPAALDSGDQPAEGIVHIRGVSPSRPGYD